MIARSEPMRDEAEDSFAAKVRLSTRVRALERFAAARIAEEAALAAIEARVSETARAMVKAKDWDAAALEAKAGRQMLGMVARDYAAAHAKSRSVAVEVLAELGVRP